MAQGHESHCMGWSVGSQPLVVDFSAGCLVEDAGLLVVRQLEYVQAIRALGARDVRVMLGHVLPNVIAPVVIATATTA